MHHDVLDAGEGALDAVVDRLGDGVALAESQIAVQPDLQIHIDAAAELPGGEAVDWYTDSQSGGSDVLNKPKSLQKLVKNCNFVTTYLTHINSL